ncbi:MAG: hypothetical protein QOK40_2442 [Miltoncostaeaceae bacterium]|jgi:hypothetical protein|nr:hypothetical protein [Miltoncostaeaceae bacterium]
MLSHVFRGRFRLLMALAMAIGVFPVASASAALSPGSAGVVANAYGSYVSVAQVVTIGRTAVAGLSCNADPATNPMDSNTVATVNLPVIGSLGVLNSEVSAGPSNGGLQSRAKSNLAQLNLLGGLISGTLVQSSVVATMDSNGNISFDTSGSSLVDLNVAGIKIAANAAPNTQIDLNVVGITGHVVLNEQTTSSAGRVMSVKAVHVVIDMPDLLRGLLGVKPLTEVVIAQARAGFTDSKTSLDGMAYGSLVKVGGLLRLGPSARVGLPCKGTGGTPVTNTLLSINLPPILNLGVMNTSVNGEAIAGGTSYSESSAEVLNLNLLGLVKADVIKSVAYAEKTGNTVTLKTEGPKAGKTQFLTLIVLGNPITIDVAPNTKVSIPGLATLWLNRVIKGSDFIEVRGLDLSVLNNNPLGVLLGTTVRLAVAHASVH